MNTQVLNNDKNQMCGYMDRLTERQRRMVLAGALALIEYNESTRPSLRLVSQNPSLLTDVPEPSQLVAAEALAVTQ